MIDKYKLMQTYTIFDQSEKIICYFGKFKPHTI